jgi:hypothetical protein
METRRRWLARWLAGTTLMGGLLAGTGCDMGSLAYFLMPEAREPAVIKDLASQDAKKENKVLILAWSGLETRAEFIHADRQLAELLAKQLTTQCEANQEKINIISVRKAEEFKNNNPNWRSMEMPDIGRRFGADYVIYLEINSLSLYEQGSSKTLYRGVANISVNLIDVRNPDELPQQQPFQCIYPSEARGPIPAGFDSSPVQFRQLFLGHVAKRLAWHFVRYPKRESFYVE